MTTHIDRNTDGVVEFCINEAEAIKDRDDLDIDKKTRHMLAFLNQAMQWAKLNLANKHLMLKAPEIAKNRAIVLQIGQPALEVVATEEPEKKVASK